MKTLVILIMLLFMVSTGTGSELDAKTTKKMIDQAENLLKDKSPEEAIKVLNEILGKNPKNEKALYLKGQAQNMQENFRDAIKSYDKVLSINPDNSEAMAGRCQSLIALEKCKDGQECCRDLVNMDSKSETYRVLAGNALTNSACFEDVAGGQRYVSEFYLDAMAYYDEALALNKNSTSAWNNKGIALGKLGTTIGDAEKINESLSCFEAAIKINSSLAEAWNNKGVTLDLWGEWEMDHAKNRMAEIRHLEALNCYDQALLIDSNLAEAMFNKAETLGLNESAFQSAQEYHKKAVEIKPQLSGKIGWIYIEIVPPIQSEIQK